MLFEHSDISFKSLGKSGRKSGIIVNGKARDSHRAVSFPLVKKLLDQSRIDDVKRVSEDEAYRDQLIKEFGIN